MKLSENESDNLRDDLGIHSGDEKNIWMLLKCSSGKTHRGVLKLLNAVLKTIFQSIGRFRRNYPVMRGGIGFPRHL